MSRIRPTIAVGAMLTAVVVLTPASGRGVATFTVTKTADTADGACDSDCSLREAIMEANSSTDTDIIEVPAGHYRLTITGPPENTGASGDLEVMNSVTIRGAGVGSTIIDAGEEAGLGERVFEVGAFDTSTTFEITLSDLTITGGYMDTTFTGTGGGMMVRPGVDVDLIDVNVIDNYVSFSGAGIQVDPGSTLSVVRTIVADNSTTFTGLGAGIMADGDATTIVDSLIAGNSAITDGGGLAIFGTAVTVRNTTISGNRADGSGGGVYSDSSAIVDLRNVTITNNTADRNQAGGGDGGGIFRTGGTVTLRNTILAENHDASTMGLVHQDCSGTLASGGHNLIGRTDGCTFPATSGDQVGSSASPIDPRLLPLADNGGPTATHALIKASPAVDAGGSDCEATDQRGLGRGTCDIGAYELTLCARAVVNRIGTPGKDVLKGTSGPDGLIGFQGNDKLSGKGGKDGLCGGPGKDSLRGGAGKDRLKGQQGKDTCVGGGGRDRAVCEEERGIP